MADPKLNDFSRGANNRFSNDRLPGGFFREAVNLNPLNGGRVALRAGYQQRYSGTAVRGLLALGERLLIADGAALVEFDLSTNASGTLRTIDAAGVFAGCVHNNELFFCAGGESLRYTPAQGVRMWGVPTVTAQPPVTADAGGALQAGAYKFAATFLSAAGEEGGTVRSNVVLVDAAQKLEFDLPAPPAGGRVRLYMGFVNSTELYLQGDRASAGTLEVTSVVDDTPTLETQFAQPPIGGAGLVASHRGVILAATNNTLWITHPLRPYLVYPARGFFQYAAPISVVQPVDGGVYVVADKTYWLTDVETTQPAQRELHPGGAAHGSGVKLPDGSACWFGPDGLVVGSPTGQLEFKTRDNYVPMIASQAASGVVERDGNQMVVTTMRGLPKSNPLTIGDYVDAEIVYP